jgi:hypothetical protein
MYKVWEEPLGVEIVNSARHVESETTIPATHFDLDLWMKTLPRPWTVAMKATIFTGWIYDHLRPHRQATEDYEPTLKRLAEPVL